MNRALFVVVAASLVACRAIVGIDDLTVSDAGHDASMGSDASKPDAPVDAPPPPPPDAADNCNTMGGMCRSCCRTTYMMPSDRLDNFAVDTGCICGDGGACTGSGQCVGNVCSRLPGPPPGCGGCIDMTIGNGSPACNMAIDRCANDPACAPIAECERRCQ